MNNSFENIVVGKHGKNYRNPYYYEVNTTFPWGVTQPVLSHKIDGDNRFVGSFTDMLRFAPLPVPSYANAYKETVLRFVPISQVCPFYDALVAKQMYNGGLTTYKPTKLPVVDNKLLSFLLITNYCTYNLATYASTDESEGDVYALSEFPDGTNDTKNDITASLKSLLTSYYGVSSGTFPYGQIQELSGIYADGNVSFNNADFVLKMDDTSNPSHKAYVLCKLTFEGRILRSNLLGLGYSLNLQDESELTLLPLLAYYKAYFDTYFPQRETNWLQTNAYKMIRYIEAYNYTDYTFAKFNNSATAQLQAVSSQLLNILKDLSETYVTTPLDIISGARDTAEVKYDNASAIGNDKIVINNNTDQKIPQISGNISHITLSLLDKLTKFISKDSVIGAKLSTWMQVHFGSEISNSLFRDSNKIGYYRLDCKINPIFSTSDTVSGTSGEYLGSYAGTGFGYKGDNKYDFYAKECGYVIGISSVIPDSGYYQGNAFDLHAIDMDTIFMPEYDRVGYEIIPYTDIFSDNGLSDSSNFNDKGFGFVPRYSRLKTKKNIVNGDMSRRGTSDSLSPYYLDKQLITSYLHAIPYTKGNNAGAYTINSYKMEPPRASQEWQYPTKYPWLGNYNRIFYNSGSPDYLTGEISSSPDNIDDNFMSQMSFSYSVYCKMMPISRSYCTFDDDDKLLNVKQS